MPLEEVFFRLLLEGDKIYRCSNLQVFTRHKINKIIPCKISSTATWVLYARGRYRKKSQFPSLSLRLFAFTSTSPLNRFPLNFILETQENILKIYNCLNLGIN